MLSFQVASTVSRLSCQMLPIRWTLWPGPLLLQGAIAELQPPATQCEAKAHFCHVQSQGAAANQLLLKVTIKASN